MKVKVNKSIIYPCTEDGAMAWLADIHNDCYADDGDCRIDPKTEEQMDCTPIHIVFHSRVLTIPYYGAAFNYAFGEFIRAFQEEEGWIE